MDLVDMLPEPDSSWPVIVTERKEHVVWVQADSQQQALERLQNDGCWYERISDSETLINAFPEMRSPGRYDWDDVYGSAYFGSYSGLECAAHVDTHRAVENAAKRKAEAAACKAAGHPDVKFHSVGDPWCKQCGRLKPERLVADIRAAAAIAAEQEG